MKKFLFLLITVLAVCLISCDREPVKEKVNYKGSWKVMCEFITNNYTEGDSLVFYNESLNVLDTFAVSYSGAMLMTQANDTNYTDNEELGYIVYDTIDVQSHVVLSNEEYVIEVSLSHSNTGLYGGLLIYKDNERNTSIRGCKIENLSELANDYTIINSAGQSCYLRKNEGIISFSDEKGNTWTKK